MWVVRGAKSLTNRKKNKMKTVSLTLSGKRSANVKFLARFAAKHNLDTKAAAYVQNNTGQIVAVSNDQITVGEADADRIAVELLRELDGCYGRIQIHGVSEKKYAALFPNYSAAVAAEQKIHRGLGHREMAKAKAAGQWVEVA